MRITLQNRITTAMILFVIVLVSAFTVIQLYNQLRVITVFNTLQARVAADVVKNRLDEIIAGADPAADPSALRDKFAGLLSTLKTSGLVDTVLIYNAEGLIEAATRSAASGGSASSLEFLRISEALQAARAGKSFVTYIDERSRILELYIPLAAAGEKTFVSRVDFSLGNIGETMKLVYVPVAMTTIVIIIATILFGLMISKVVVGPVTLLNAATKEVAGGDLNVRIHMDTQDELEELAGTFNYMTVELKKMKARAENANPLTKLPGNIVIREEVESRIKNNKKFMVIYCDLDNFKAFNDKYGIHKGDEAIKLTAAVFREAVAQKGGSGDFLGHEGGDDFLLLTTPDRTKGISDFIMSEFDKQVRSLYNQEDLDRGYIEAHSRYGNEIMKFPIMTISLAGVTNEIRPISSYGEVTNIAAEVKKKSKAIPGSSMVIDQRRVPWPTEMPRPT